MSSSSEEDDDSESPFAFVVGRVARSAGGGAGPMGPRFEAGLALGEELRERLLGGGGGESEALRLLDR